MTTLSLAGDCTVLSADNLPSGVNADVFVEKVSGARVSEITDRTLGDMLTALTRAEGRQGHSCTIDLDGRHRRYDAEAVRREDGSLDVVLIDVTDWENEARSVENLSLELAHRTKNLLAVVQSLATQTARRTDSYDAFQSRFLGHVEALSSAHDLIAETGWRGATVPAIERVYITDAHPEMTIERKPDTDGILLKPNAVQNMAIVLRELRTVCAQSDRVRCGIAAREDGTLDLSWSCEGPHDGEAIWTDMLCRHAPVALEGQGLIDHTENGFDYRLSVGPKQRV